MSSNRRRGAADQGALMTPVPSPNRRLRPGRVERGQS